MRPNSLHKAPLADGVIARLRIDPRLRLPAVPSARQPSAARRVARRFLTADQKRLLRRSVLGLRIGRPGGLDALARYYETDKSSFSHDYTRLYEHHLRSRRRNLRTLLEIGVGGITPQVGYETLAGGQSLRMWSRYFPNATIVGIDIYPKAVSGERIQVEQGDQADSTFLASLVERYGPFDVVIDDGSHLGRDIRASFAVLWDAVRPGGFYVIEDLEVAYHPGWEGGPPGTPGTAVELIKTCVDDTLRRAQDPFQPSMAAIHVYTNDIVFFERA
jgi:hypothetical protein